MCHRLSLWVVVLFLLLVAVPFLLLVAVPFLLLVVVLFLLLVVVPFLLLVVVPFLLLVVDQVPLTPRPFGHQHQAVLCGSTWGKEHTPI